VWWVTKDTTSEKVFDSLTQATVEWSMWSTDDEFKKVVFADLDLVKVGLAAIESIYQADNPLRGEKRVYVTQQAVTVRRDLR
jgi:hypothetical protein